MTRSVSHEQTGDWSRVHTKNHRRAWLVVAMLIVAALLLTAFGYFGPVTWVALAGAIGHTAYRLAIAYGIALVLATSVGILIGWSPFADVLFPVLDVLQNIPSFALIPLFIYFFGYTNQMIILFAVGTIAWPIFFSVLAAIRNTHTDLNDAATLFGARGLKRMWYYLAPLAFPAVLTGSIVGMAIGWESVIGAEIITNAAGFGAFIQESTTKGITETTVVGIFAILVIVFVVNRLIWGPLLSESRKRYAE